MTIAGRLTVYRVKRDHSRESGFYRIDVPEVGQKGIGFQVPIGPYVCGVSVHTRKRELSDAGCRGAGRNRFGLGRL